MKRLWILWVVLGLAGVVWLFGLGGCGSSITGTFEGFQVFPKASEVVAGAVGTIHLELKPGGRFVYQRLSMPYEGDWSEEDGKIVLKIDSAMGHSASGGGLTPSKIELTPKGENELSLRDDFTELGKPILLKRVPAKT